MSNRPRQRIGQLDGGGRAVYSSTGKRYPRHHRSARQVVFHRGPVSETNARVFAEICQHAHVEAPAGIVHAQLRLRFRADERRAVDLELTLLIAHPCADRKSFLYFEGDAGIDIDGLDLRAP